MCTNEWQTSGRFNNPHAKRIKLYIWLQANRLSLNGQKTYYIEAWGNAINCYLRQLYLIQKKVIRMIAFANYNTPSIDIFTNLNILPLYKLVVDRIGIMMYKYANTSSITLCVYLK